MVDDEEKDCPSGEDRESGGKGSCVGLARRDCRVDE